VNRILFIVMLIFSLMLVSGAAIAADSSQWNQWRGAQRDGVDHASPPLINKLPENGLKPVWISESITSGMNGGWSSPVVAGGKVYLYAHSKQVKDGIKLPKRKFPWLPPDKRGHLTPAEYSQYEVDRRDEDEARAKLYQFVETLWCIDAGSGKTLWKNTKVSVYTRFVQSGSPAVVDGRVYVQGAGLAARCIDAESGKLLWETQLPGKFRDEYMMSSFAVAEGVAVVLAGRLFGLDAKTGKIIWEGDARETKGTHASPVIWKANARSMVLINVAGNYTACLEVATGKESWRVKSWANHSTPVIIEDRMITYSSSRRGGLRCYQLSTSGAEELWGYNNIFDRGSSPVVVDDHVYAQGNKELVCVSLKDGNEAWKTALPFRDPKYTSLVAADGKLLYALEGFLWFSADPSAYKPLFLGLFDKKGLLATRENHWKNLNLDKVATDEDGRKKAEKIYKQQIGRNAPLTCSSPALAGGRVYLRMKNAVACYDLKRTN